MNISLGNSWHKKLTKSINDTSFEVGILDDKPHKNPVSSSINKPPDLRNYAGGPIRKTSAEFSGLSIGDVFTENMERTNRNFLLLPFQKENSDILKFTDAFLKYIVGRAGVSVKRVENLLQAIVRNPILKEEYGNNKAVTADIKGFDRHLFDTGQTFKAIKARMFKKG